MRKRGDHGRLGGALQALWLGLLVGVLPPTLSACDGVVGDPDAGPDGGPGDDFDDHTRSRLSSVNEFEEIAAADGSRAALKFIVTRFNQPGPNARFLESSHYALHDEWYWFRLLNKAPIDGVDVEPVNAGRSFATIAEIVTWARGIPAESLPLDLQFVNDGRLYSPNFYQLSVFGSPRVLGIGTVLHIRARPDVGLEEHWALELEYQHAVTVPELVQLFAVLEDALPPGVGSQVKLLLRSPAHEALAHELEQSGSPLAARMLRYEEITVPGETEVYSEGLVAGRLKVVRRGESFDDARSSDVLLAEDIPDFLPQCAGLVTAAPQTALAHVNILAKNRGIPNAYRGGVLDDPNLDQLARVRAPVILKATAPGELRVVAMTNDDFALYRNLTAVPPTAVPSVDLTDVAAAYDLQALSFADEARWRPVLGGKSTGFLALLSAQDVTMPPRPVGISIKPYVEHIEETAALRPRLEAMLQDSIFAGNVDVRSLVLEGGDAWMERHPDRPLFPNQFITSRPVNDVLRVLVEEGGVTGVIRSTPIAPATLADILAALERNFGAYADGQGLRFRSSSNVEDAEGFNGAGLYTSNTGYLHAERLADSRSNKTVERAVLETWASYWGSEAFEERRLANVAHLSGSMGVAVHANFQDELEIGNAVFTYTILPPGHPDGAAILEVNAQEGSLSVTNPPPGDPNLPEVDRLRLNDDGVLAIERVRGSTVLPPGSFVLSEAQLTQVFAEARRVAEGWFVVDNAALPTAQRRSTLTLDFELREMAQGWPALSTGNVFASRVVVKQVRTLEPSIARVPEDVRVMPIPRDLLARALRVERRSCEAAEVRVTLVEVFTDPLKKPDLGYVDAPFTAFVVVDFLQNVAALGAAAGQRRSVIHTAFAADHPAMDSGGPWALELIVEPEVAAGVHLSRLAFAEPTLTITDTESLHTTAVCGAATLFASPEAFLESLLVP